MTLSYVLASSIHAITAVLWIGGIFLAYRIVRPTLMEVEPPVRLTLWYGVFKRFFPWVWLFILLLVISGYWDWYNRFESFATAPFYLHLMQGVGWLMIGLFVWLYFVPFAKFKHFVEQKNFAKAGQILNNKMRPVIATNLFLGIFETIIGASGPFW